MRSLLFSLLLPSCLTAQEAGKLDLHTDLGAPTDPIRLVAQGAGTA